MAAQVIKAKVFRFDPSSEEKSHYQVYEVPYEKGISAMDVLDYIYQNLDSSLAYYDHAGCSLGICGKCVGKVNGKAGLFCQIPVEGDIVLEPVSHSRVLRDLVCKSGRGGNSKDPGNGSG